MAPGRCQGVCNCCCVSRTLFTEQSRLNSFSPTSQRKTCANGLGFCKRIASGVSELTGLAKILPLALSFSVRLRIHACNRTCFFHISKCSPFALMHSSHLCIHFSKNADNWCFWMFYMMPLSMATWSFGDSGRATPLSFSLMYGNKKKSEGERMAGAGFF